MKRGGVRPAHRSEGEKGVCLRRVAPAERGTDRRVDAALREQPLFERKGRERDGRLPSENAKNPLGAERRRALLAKRRRRYEQSQRLRRERRAAVKP